GAYEVAWSPSSAAFAVYAQDGDDSWTVSVIDVATAATTVISRFPAGWERGELAWSPDGTRVAFQTDSRPASSTVPYRAEAGCVVTLVGALARHHVSQ